MKKSVGEIERIAGGVAVLAFFQIASQDWSERRVIEESARQRIEQRRKAADARAPHQPSRAKHAVSLLQTGEPVFPFDQMVERAQEQHCVRRGVAVGQMARISNLRTRQRMLRL